MEDTQVMNESSLLAHKPVRQARRKPRPLFGDPDALESQQKAVKLEMDLEVLNQKALAQGKARAALLKSGVSESEIGNAQRIKFYIWNESHEETGGEATLTPYMPTVMTQFDKETGFPLDLPRGQNGLFLYHPTEPVTAQNKEQHMEMCRQRINTIRIANSLKVPENFDRERNRPEPTRSAFKTNAGEL